ncbi:MAG: Eco57I restriction-modification methylase domain-containing protein [Bacteroidales bacterium]|nr:Eco57I restriction-modification methylase domain-containing protein [Bacteroidales bacterium]
MLLNILTPRKSLNKAFLKIKPSRQGIETFKNNLIRLLDGLDQNESEEHNKNDLCDFLRNTFYSSGYYLNTKDRNDLVIHSGSDSKSLPGVLMEVKKPGNKSEMIQKENLNAKAFQELILYYLRERIINGNLEIKHLIATNIYEWFIFDASVFERTFAQNKSLVRQFKDFEEGRLAGTTTDFFYHSVAGPFIAALTTEIEFTWFDIREYDAPLHNADKADDAKLIALFKVLSPEHLLKLPFSNDSNTLDRAFYSELLHIIGLTETKSGSKKVIGRKSEGNRNPGSLLENAILQIDTRDKISRLPKPSQFGDSAEEWLFNVSLELVITWLNRVLFLKLLEAQLIRYHQGDSEYGFLNISRISSFDDLDNLFFRVLARRTAERDSGMAKSFSKVPYLNSSLFEPTELEHQTIFISNLQDNALIPISSSTVLKDNSGKKRSGNLSGLQYLFEFLDAYDFAGEVSEEIQEENKTLINASVLGLIFEKLNGYKDGSFFTPGFITMYMSRETIRRAVVQKFNDLKGWNCEDITGIYNKIDDILEANKVIDSLKICDPAVGSGHFLVSALNEIISIKSDLRILSDRQGKRLKEYHVDVVNDELIITDEDGELFEYNPASRERQRVQEAIFHEKQTIIENCLFGVDINPNSVKICRLRLWIELLKNAYYKADSNNTELETLPNIDINIKCGNSLISRYTLDSDIRQALKNSKWSIESYRLAVMSYRNATNKEEKRSMERLIESIKSDFETTVAANDKRVIQLRKLNGDLFNLTHQTSLFDQTKKEKDAWNKKVKELTEKIKKLETKLEEIKSNKVFENAFEWRFEFPEVLNDEGDFVGFDVVIGNPPYIRTKDIPDNQKIIYWQEFESFEKKADIYCCFIELVIRILKTANGFLSYIISNSWLRLDSFETLRKIILQRNKIITVIDFTDYIFEEASIHTNILTLQKIKQSKNSIDVAVISPKTFMDKNFIFRKIEQQEFEGTYKNIFDLSIDLITSVHLNNFKLL